MINLSPQWTLIVGLTLSVFLQNSKLQSFSKRWIGPVLQFSVILLGASLDFKAAFQQGAFHVGVTFFSIILTLIFGLVGSLVFKIEKTQAALISVGTAICGGSAIGAIAPVIRANHFSLTVAIGIVFLLNATAVFIFPFMGNLLDLSQTQFGTWAALAIHDTSSVVAATIQYGDKALAVGTLVKLTRALWIVPLVFGFSFFRDRSKTQNGEFTFPWFIIGFVLMSALFTFSDISADIKTQIIEFSKLGFAITLFLIGLSLNFSQIKALGFRPLIFGSLLWIVATLASLWFVLTFIR